MTARRDHGIWPFVRIAIAGCVGILLGVLARPWVRGLRDASSEPAALDGSVGGSRHPAGESGDGGVWEGRDGWGSGGHPKGFGPGGRVARDPAAIRWLEAASEAESAAAERFPTLLRKAGGDRALKEMLAARWAAINPSHMLDTLLAERATGIRTLDGDGHLALDLVRDWAARDPSGVASALASPDRILQGTDPLLNTAINEIVARDPSLGLRLMNDWNLRYFVPDLRSVAEWAADDPRRAAEEVTGLGSSIGGQEAMRQVARVWAASDPDAALEFAAGAGGPLAGELARSVMRDLAGSDLPRAVALASKHAVDPAMAARIADPLVSEWAKSDPVAALAWSQENLRAPGRAEAMRSVIGSLAQSDLDAAAAVVAGLPPGGGRDAAAQGVLSVWTTAKEVDVDALGAWLDGLGDSDTARRAMESVESRWFAKSPGSVEAFVSGPHGGRATDGMVRRVAEAKTRRDPSAAVRWAASLPAAGDEPGRATRFVVESWYATQPLAAMKWAATAPDPAIRGVAIESISRSVAFGSSEQLRGWLDRLAPDDRRSTEEMLAGMRFAPAVDANVRAAIGR